jgi:hypothetical protein
MIDGIWQGAEHPRVEEPESLVIFTLSPEAGSTDFPPELSPYQPSGNMK